MRKIILFIAAFSLHSAGAAVHLKPSGGGVDFIAVGRPSFLKIHGKGKPVTGELVVQDGQVDGQVDFELNSLDTGIGLRNGHMKEKFLEVAKYPEARLSLSAQALPRAWSPESAQMDSVAFTGQLTLHGVSKSVSGHFKISEEREVEADFKIKLSDFGIDIPRYAGITVADEVQIKVRIDDLNELKATR